MGNVRSRVATIPAGRGLHQRHIRTRRLHNAHVDPETISVDEAAERLGVSAQTVRRWTERDPSDPSYLASYRLNPNAPRSNRRVYVDAVEKMLAARRREPDS